MKNYLKEFVYGATDGVVTTFAIIAGTVGANLDPIIVILLGISNVLADGFSMAASNYLSSRSDNALQGTPDAHYGGESLRNAVVTFIAFVLVGSIPLIPFVLARSIESLYPYQFLIASIGTGLAFVFIGAVRGHVTKHSIVVTALETLIVGSIAASIAYYVGSWVKTFV